MSNIKNKANPVDTLTDVNRAQIEHRATWMGLIFDEMVKAGLDAEGITRRAIRKCGHVHGEKIKSNCKDPSSCVDFKNAFLPDLVQKTFDMRPIDAAKDTLNVDFHYCALVSAWQKLGFDDKTCELLCDIAMEGDRGIADILGLTLDLKDTIAKGCTDCKLRFHK